MKPSRDTTRAIISALRAGESGAHKRLTAQICTSATSFAESSSSNSERPSNRHPTTRGRRGPAQRNVLPPYPEWINGQGKAFENAPVGKGPFWIGSTPFPLNPTFHPSPPLSQKVREQMWNLHTSDPQKNTVRTLSVRFRAQMERVEAVLRLMALENDWAREGKALQIPFQTQMERLLGSSQDVASLSREIEPAQTSTNTNPRGPIREELPMGVGSENIPSAIAPALAQEAKERAARLRSLPTGGPSVKGPPLQTNVVEASSDPRKPRSMLSITDLSSRPSSYGGAGKVQRNERRAERRKKNRARKREKQSA